MNKAAIVVFICVILAAVAVIFLRARGQRRPGNANFIQVDPSNILFSTPTLCDLAPGVDPQSARPNKDDFVLHEDNWRQSEFVALNDEAYLAKLVQEVSNFEQSNRMGMGWKHVFIRKEHPTPVKTLGLSFRILVEFFQPPDGVRSIFLSTGSSATKVNSGFALKVDKLGVIYGQKHDDSIVELGFEPLWTDAPSDSRLAALSNYCGQNHLLIVDWYQRKLINFKENRPSWGPRK